MAFNRHLLWLESARFVLNYRDKLGVRYLDLVSFGSLEACVRPAPASDRDLGQSLGPVVDVPVEAWMSVKEKSGMKNLFVGNMSFQTTEGDLRAIFEPFGQVARVHIAMDRETGRSRGFGFVEMPNDEEAAKAIAGLDGKAVGGRNLKVNEARPKGESSGPRGPRSGGGGDRGDRGDRGNRGRFSNEDYREAARQPREPRW